MWAGGTIPEGAGGRFRSSHKTNIGETLADEIRKRSGEETIASELTYDLRSGDPDALDQTVAITFANIAVDLIRDGMTGAWSRSTVATSCTRHFPIRSSGHGA